MAWELAEYAARGSRADHPTLSSMADAVDRYYVLKAVVFFLWLCLGAAIVRQGRAAGPRRRRRPECAVSRRALLRGVGPPGPGHARAVGPVPRRGAAPARPGVVLERLATGPFLRVALVLAWMWAGWHLFAR